MIRYGLPFTRSKPSTLPGQLAFDKQTEVLYVANAQMSGVMKVHLDAVASSPDIIVQQIALQLSDGKIDQRVYWSSTAHETTMLAEFINRTAGIAFNAETCALYVASYDSGDIAVINTQTDQVVGIIETDHAFPTGLTINKEGTMLHSIALHKMLYPKLYPDSNDLYLRTIHHPLYHILGEGKNSLCDDYANTITIGGSTQASTSSVKNSTIRNFKKRRVVRVSAEVMSVPIESSAPLNLKPNSLTARPGSDELWVTGEDGKGVVVDIANDSKPKFYRAIDILQEGTTLSFRKDRDEYFKCQRVTNDQGREGADQAGQVGGGRRLLSSVRSDMSEADGSDKKAEGEEDEGWPDLFQVPDIGLYCLGATYGRSDRLWVWDGAHPTHPLVEYGRPENRAPYTTRYMIPLLNRTFTTPGQLEMDRYNEYLYIINRNLDGVIKLDLSGGREGTPLYLRGMKFKSSPMDHYRVPGVEYRYGTVQPKSLIVAGEIKSPSGIAYDDYNCVLYVSSSTDGNISVISTRTNEIIGVLQTNQNFPTGLIFRRHRLYSVSQQHMIYPQLFSNPQRSTLLLNVIHDPMKQLNLTSQCGKVHTDVKAGAAAQQGEQSRTVAMGPADSNFWPPKKRKSQGVAVTNSRIGVVGGRYQPKWRQPEHTKFYRWQNKNRQVGTLSPYLRLSPVPPSP